MREKKTRGCSESAAPQAAPGPQIPKGINEPHFPRPCGARGKISNLKEVLAAERIYRPGRAALWYLGLGQTWGSWKQSKFLKPNHPTLPPSTVWRTFGLLRALSCHPTNPFPQLWEHFSRTSLTFCPLGEEEESEVPLRVIFSTAVLLNWRLAGWREDATFTSRGLRRIILWSHRRDVLWVRHVL